MKKINLLILILVISNLVFYAKSQINKTTTEVVTLDTIEILNEGEGEGKNCLAGGKNSTSCSIEGGIELDLGVTISCSVSCNEKAYACCHLKCECIPF